MFGIGLPEFIVIMVVALIVVGPDKMPGLAKSVAKQILELKKAANSLKDSLNEELSEEREALKELSAEVRAIDLGLDEVGKAAVNASLSQELADTSQEVGVEEVADSVEETADSSSGLDQTNEDQPQSSAVDKSHG